MDYYNDFQNMVRSDDIARVIDRYREWRGRECLTEEQIRSRDDVKAVLDAIYAASPASYGALIRLAGVCSELSARQFALLVHVLRGGTFTQYATDEGVTPAAVGQRWKTAVRRCQELSEVKGRSNGTRRVLEKDEGEGVSQARRPVH